MGPLPRRYGGIPPPAPAGITRTPQGTCAVCKAPLVAVFLVHDDAGGAVKIAGVWLHPCAHRNRATDIERAVSSVDDADTVTITVDFYTSTLTAFAESGGAFRVTVQAVGRHIHGATVQWPVGH